MVLLKNEASFLPLDGSALTTVAVVGEHRVQCELLGSDPALGSDCRDRGLECRLVVGFVGHLEQQVEARDQVAAELVAGPLGGLGERRAQPALARVEQQPFEPGAILPALALVEERVSKLLSLGRVEERDLPSQLSDAGDVARPLGDADRLVSILCNN